MTLNYFNGKINPSSKGFVITKKTTIIILLLNLCVWISACQRMQNLPEIMHAAPFDSLSHHQSAFDLKLWLNYQPGSIPHPKSIRIYLHGDGLPWLGEGRIALDPSPRYTLAWDLMHADKAPAAFLSRPCYFTSTEKPNCHPRYWTNARYSQDIVTALIKQIEQFCHDNKIESVTLIGHSGGGTLAVLIAQELDIPVDEVITIAGNLDIEAWTSLHEYSPLDGSLNPAKLPPLIGIKQRHYCGKNDKNIPPDTGRAYFSSQKQHCRIVEASHTHNWLHLWPKLLQEFK